MAFKNVKMGVSKSTASGKREVVGEVDIFVPTLADVLEVIGKAEQAVGEDKKPLFDDDGLPVYTTDEANWAQNAVYTQVKAQARNRLKPQSLELKSDIAIAKDWAMLTAENTGAGNPAALIANRELKALFATWVASLGKSAAAQTLITSLFNNREALKAQDKATKEKMTAYSTEFAQTLNAEQLTKYEKGLQTVLDICSTDTQADDF